MEPYKDPQTQSLFSFTSWENDQKSTDTKNFGINKSGTSLGAISSCPKVPCSAFQIIIWKVLKNMEMSKHHNDRNGDGF